MWVWWLEDPGTWDAQAAASAWPAEKEGRYGFLSKRPAWRWRVVWEMLLPTPPPKAGWPGLPHPGAQCTWKWKQAVLVLRDPHYHLGEALEAVV